ncbi:nucleoid-associated protein [Bartonella henselae]|uniref:Nucleoid-associated protein BM1374165_00239 n=1 Tax=Bartonella henselae TaxID=38323 RepID=X5LUQ1_BARHN|nr:YbaB/EbfC family nucleoid-associated protein [Bartonella henselae]MDM9996189.1 YbaB/EbfC family nucleoid-associated protein [Bartonella henselae]OLL48010.1 nucleoid-associated protein [Bartonella henselae]OLL48292.1 nucleoid-associated protein [Bartonella henselae]OLL51816.1 nucleoid-associated protein [Bartonella henselae]OLL57583.1 nucleoid-associated protein [Bartonella henselae]
MRDMMNMMKKAKEMQEKMQKIQEEMANLQVTGTAGGGLVSITLNGKNTITAIKIDPSLLKPEEIEILEDLIMAAYNEAKTKIEIAMQEKTKSMTAELPLPPDFKLPFS